MHGLKAGRFRKIRRTKDADKGTIKQVDNTVTNAPIYPYGV